MKFKLGLSAEEKPGVGGSGGVETSLLPRNMADKAESALSFMAEDGSTPPPAIYIVRPTRRQSPLRHQVALTRAEMLSHKKPSVVGRRAPSTNRSLVLMPNDHLSLVTVSREDKRRMHTNAIAEVI